MHDTKTNKEVSVLEENNLVTCEVCGKITENLSHNCIKKFCSRKCKKRALYLRKKSALGVSVKTYHKREASTESQPKSNPIKLVLASVVAKIKKPISVASVIDLPCFACDIQHRCDSRFCQKLDEWMMQND